MRHAAAEAGLRFELLDWKHPRQTWALFAAPKFDWDGSRTNLSLGMQGLPRRLRKTKAKISLLQHRRLLPISRTRKAMSTIRTDCDRFTIMNSWTIQFFEELTSAVFAPRATIIDGTGGFTSVCGRLPAPLDSRRLRRVWREPRFPLLNDHGLSELGFLGKTVLSAGYFSRPG